MRREPPIGARETQKLPRLLCSTGIARTGASETVWKEQVGQHTMPSQNTLLKRQRVARQCIRCIIANALPATATRSAVDHELRPGSPSGSIHRRGCWNLTIVSQEAILRKPNG